MKIREMNVSTLSAPELVEVLNLHYPPKCIQPGETLEDAHRYAGKRELVDFLITILKREERNSE